MHSQHLVHKKHNRKVTFNAGEFATEIDFVLVGKEQRKYLKDIKTVPWKLQPMLFFSNIDFDQLTKRSTKHLVILILLFGHV